MTGRARLLLVALVAGMCLALARDAAAYEDLHPGRAAADVEAAMKARDLAFCREPRRPLAPSARALCSHASAIPECAGFAAACNDEVAPRDEDGLLTRFVRWLGKLVPKGLLSALEALARLPAYLFLALVFAVVVAAVFPMARAVRRIRRDAALSEPLTRAPKEREATPAVETTDDEVLLGLADEHARTGRLEQALQLYLAASLRALDRRGAVRWARDRTNGEYARACTEEASRGPLREIVREVDRAQFGREPPAVAAVTRAAQLATSIVRRAAPAALLTLALLLLGGCGHGPRAGDDPAGDELFHELLQRQATRVDSLETTLRELPMPRDVGDPALVVDVETTAIDDETRDHLVQWVRAGGDLVLLGAPESWPREMRTGFRPTEDHDLSVTGLGEEADRATVVWPGHLAKPAALQLDEPAKAEGDGGEDTEEEEPDRVNRISRVAWLGDGSIYAASWPLGRGSVLGVASDELTTNAALARPGNAAALVSILAASGATAFTLAEPEDGSSAPSSPLTALSHAGLGLGMVHALIAAALLFLAAGVRLAAPTPTPPARRRAFAEHVEAVGALYAGAGAARHALAAYGRFVEQRLRARMPRGATDLAAFLAGRADLPLETCERLLNGASAAAGPQAGDRSGDDDLMVLKELSAAYAAAIAKDG
jgi:hypothetical protein